jgi:hypothetical protein
MKPKTGPYTPKEDNQLLKIPYMTGHGNPSGTAVKALAKSWGRNPANVWQHWYALHGKGKSAIKPKNSAPAGVDTRSGGIPPMVFKSVIFDGKRKVTDEERISMEKGLDISIKTALSNPVRGILFPARMMNRAKQYLKKAYAKNIFTFHTNKKDRKYVILKKSL